MLLMLEGAIIIAVALSAAIAAAEAQNSNWRGTTLGTVLSLIGAVALF